eukprot:scaffold2264_cov287-Pinguiococcus_pyrenoidosus.AAC.4
MEGRTACFLGVDHVASTQYFAHLALPEPRSGGESLCFHVPPGRVTGGRKGSSESLRRRECVEISATQDHGSTRGNGRLQQTQSSILIGWHVF